MKKNRKYFKGILIIITMFISCALVIQATNDRGSTPKAGQNVITKIVEDSATGQLGEVDKIVYSGPWSSGSAVDCSNNDEHYANTNNAGFATQEVSYTITFKGVAISLYGNKAPALGKSQIFIDGDTVGEEINLLNPTRITKQLLFKKEGLNNTVHTIKIVCSKDGGTLKGIHFDYAQVSEIEENTDDSLSVSPTSIDMKVSGQAEITANLKEGVVSDILWESSDPSIAEIESGQVMAKKAGTCNMIIICEKTNLTFTIPVHVTDSD